MLRAIRAGAVLAPAVASCFLAAMPARGQVVGEIQTIDPPRQGFYGKRLMIRGIAILAHASVSDAAVEEAGRRIERLVGRSPDIAANLAALGTEMHVIGKDQQTTDLPMYRHMKGKPFAGEQTMDQRGRGYGGLLASCSEENLLLLPEDRFREHRDICSHEFAHTILGHGVCREVRGQVERRYAAAMAAGLWKTAYAGTSAHEYFAELTMWYLGSRGDYGKIAPNPQKGATWLRSYDPGGYELLDGIYSGRISPGKLEVEDLPRLGPEAEGKVRSRDGQPATEVIFLNRTDGPVKRYWLDTRGSRRPYGEIPAGGTSSQSTYATHAWLLERPDGRVLGIYVPTAKVGRIIVEDPPPSRPGPTTRPGRLGSGLDS